MYVLFMVLSISFKVNIRMTQYQRKNFEGYGNTDQTNLLRSDNMTAYEYYVASVGTRRNKGKINRMPNLNKTQQTYILWGYGDWPV